MADRAIHVGEEPLMARNKDHGVAAGAKYLTEAANCDRRIVEVLEDVDADDAVERSP